MKKNRNKYNFILTTLLLIVGFSNRIWSQNATKQELLFIESETLCNSKPDEAIKIGKLLLNSNSTDKEKAKINLLFAKIYQVKGNYNTALTYLFEVNKNPIAVEKEDLIEANIRKAEILRLLYLDNQSKKYLGAATTKIQLIDDKKKQNSIYARIVIEKVLLLIERQNFVEASRLINKEEIKFVDELQGNNDLNENYLIAKGKIYLGLTNYDKALYYFNQLKTVILKDKNSNKIAEINCNIGLASVFFQKKNYQEAINLLQQSLVISKELDNLYLSEIIHKNLAINYLAMNNEVDYKANNTDLLEVSVEFENQEQEAVNTAHNLITQEYDDLYEFNRKKFNNKLYIFLGSSLAILLLCFIFWYKLFSNKKRLREIINYLEITRTNSIIVKVESEDDKKEVNKKIIIPIETENGLLVKLKRFENSSRFINKEMSLAVLAGQLDTNTKYLSEIINKHYNVNFNGYINKLRINYIVNKLKTDSNFINYKISYLAEACGFSSHSTFATIFKSITGITPITFIELLKKEKEEGITSNSEYETE